MNNPTFRVIAFRDSERFDAGTFPTIDHARRVKSRLQREFPDWSFLIRQDFPASIDAMLRAIAARNRNRDKIGTYAPPKP